MQYVNTNTPIIITTMAHYEIWQGHFYLPLILVTVDFYWNLFRIVEVLGMLCSDHFYFHLTHKIRQWHLQLFLSSFVFFYSAEEMENEEETPTNGKSLIVILCFMHPTLSHTLARTGG